MKRKRKVGIGFKIFSLILILISLLLIFLVVHLGILNTTLLIAVISILVLINILCIFLLLKSKKKKLGLFISTILIIIYSFISFYIYRTTYFLSNLDSNYKTYNYSIVVLKSSEDDKLKDIENKTLGYYNEETEITEESLDKVTDKIEIDVEAYDNTHELSNDLIENKIDAILIEDSYLDVIEIDGTTIIDKVKKIYSFSIKIEIDDLSKDINVTKESFNIYVSGIDTYGEITSVSRSDVNMVVTVNPRTRQILLTSIPRDYYVELHGKNSKDKLTHAGMYGTEMSIDTIEDLLDIEINYYVKVNFSSVIDIVNAIGGVKVYSDYTFTSMDNYNYKEGYNDVNGEEALSFARERKAFLVGDRQRVKNQQALLKAIFEKCTSKSIITKYTKLLDSLSNSFVTNMKMNRMTSLVRMQLANNYSWNIISNSLNGTDSSNYTYSTPSTRAYVMEPTEESIDYAKELITNVQEGIILDKEEIEGNQTKINGVVSSQSNSSKNDTKKETAPAPKEEQVQVKEEGLKAKLIKSNIEITEGDDYIYNGVTATYNKEDITESIEITFKIGTKELDDYHELILYISKLKSGNYNIDHIVTYKGETLTLTQNLTIKELPQTNAKEDEEEILPDDSVLNESSNETIEE